MQNNRFNFTIRALYSIQPKNVTSYYYDSHTRGLGLYVTSKGIKTYFVYRKVEGKPQRIILGRMDEISLEKAREKTQEVHVQISQGINPHENMVAIRQEIVLGELWNAFWEYHAVPSRKSRRNDKCAYDLYLSQWADKKLSHITSTTIRELHQRMISLS